MKFIIFPALTLLLCLLTPGSYASDHADPILIKNNAGSLTGLFFFPHQDRYIVILNVLRGLKKPPPYDVNKYTYSLFFDFHTQVSHGNPEDQVRYGGTVLAPERITADASIVFHVDSSAKLEAKTTTGFEDPKQIQYFAGVRDDPFVFPKFFGTNVVAMVASIPMSAFPQDRKHWIIWATSIHREELLGLEKPYQVDGLGRSNRTMNPRLDFLNQYPPNQHLAEIKRHHDDPGLIDAALMKYAMPFFAIRHCDFQPDIMIFSKQYAPGFPNGRLLTDDVADLTCRIGDCLLWELSYADSDAFPRKTTNDKAFLEHFPFLAEPWPSTP